jgi:hypothetical protein
MPLFRFPKRDKSIDLAKEYESKVSLGMRDLLRKAIEKGHGDPFYQYRSEKQLPEKFIYGMNCFFDRLAEKYGDNYAQRVYDELKKMPQTYTILRDASGVDLINVPILFTVQLRAGIDAENIARTEYYGCVNLLLYYVQIEPEPESNVQLDTFINTVNEKVPKEDSLTVIKVKKEKLESFSGKLSEYQMGSMIIYKSRIGQYYNFLKIISAMDKDYAYGPNDRKVPLSFITDESNGLILITPIKMRQTYFKTEQELSKKETSIIQMVYKYKPISETYRTYKDTERTV